ncbi:hypothetical protein Syun_016848 [Stephania yunnanensis]|uniref:Uncharacterized protein n=1 Tax=Stephania yunnanensis TaxID=152371 RepID=A0AAP0P5A2_9MAGN
MTPNQNGLSQWVGVVADVDTWIAPFEKALSMCHGHVRRITQITPSQKAISVGCKADYQQAGQREDRRLFMSPRDEDCLKILKGCGEAIILKEKGGKVIIIDIILDPDKGTPA